VSDPADSLCIVAPAVTLIALAANAVFASFFLSILGLKRRSKKGLTSADE